MADPPAPSVLRRKLVPPPEAPRLSRCREAWPAIAAEGLGIVMDVTAATQVSEDREAVVGRIVDQDLILEVRSDQSIHGLAILDAGCLGALVEARTLGRVSSGERRSRTPTAVDAMLVHATVAQWLRAADLTDPEVAVQLGAQIADARAARFALPQGSLEVLTVAVTFEPAGEGQVVIATRAPPEARSSVPNPRDILADVEVALDVVLARLSRRISDIADLEVGTSFRIPDDAFRKVEIVGLENTLVATASLGRLGDLRAVRIHGSGPATRDNVSETQPRALDADSGQDAKTSPLPVSKDQPEDEA